MGSIFWSEISTTCGCAAATESLSEGLPADGLIWDNFDYTKDPNTFFVANYGFENIAPANGDSSKTVKNQEGGEFSPRLSKLENKINVLGELAIGIYASVVTSSFWLFLYIIGLKGYAIAAALVLSPFAFMIIFWKLKQAWNKDNPP